MHLFKHICILMALQGIVTFAWATNSGHRDIEHHIKAVFIYKFAAYVEWPSFVFPEADASFVIGVVGADEIATELINLSYETEVGGRPIQIRRFSLNDDPNDLHILFIGRDKINSSSSLLNDLRSKPVLIVTESRGALAAGSIINFVPVGDYIRFEISTINADLKNLKISARLLDVAQTIENRRP